MLRESSKIAGYKIKLSDVTFGLSDETHIPQGNLLIDFAEAIVARDRDAITVARSKLFRVLGNDAVVDAVAIAAAFHGFVRIADATGIPYTTAARGGDAADIREKAGINEFYLIKKPS
jgi:hypothetical protein